MYKVLEYSKVVGYLLKSKILTDQIDTCRPIRKTHILIILYVDQPIMILTSANWSTINVLLIFYRVRFRVLDDLYNLNAMLRKLMISLSLLRKTTSNGLQETKKVFWVEKYNWLVCKQFYQNLCISYRSYDCTYQCNLCVFKPVCIGLHFKLAQVVVVAPRDFLP